MNVRLSALLLLALALTVPGPSCPFPIPIPDPEPPAGTVDLSNFREFEYSEGGGVGCGPEDTSFDAGITRQDDGTYTVEFSAVTTEDWGLGDMGWDDVDDGTAWSLYVPEGEDYPIRSEIAPAIPPRVLSPAEVQRVLQVFSVVQTKAEDYAGGICTDGCPDYYVQWDDFEPAVGFGCYEGRVQRLDGSTMDAIQALLADLRAASE